MAAPSPEQESSVVPWMDDGGIDLIKEQKKEAYEEGGAFSLGGRALICLGM